MERVPMPGDAVRATNSDRVLVRNGQVGVINGTVGQAHNLYLVTFGPTSLFRGPAYKGGSSEFVTIDGAPLWTINATDLVATEETHEFLFWRWKNRPQRGGGKETYALKVPLWELDVEAYLESR